MSEKAMEDEWYAHQAFEKLKRGDPLDEVYETDYTPEDIFAQLDAMDAADAAEKELNEADWTDVNE